MRVLIYLFEIYFLLIKGNCRSLILALSLTLPLSFVSAQVGREVICYFNSWSFYREGTVGNFTVEDVDPNLCTHIIYNYLGIWGPTSEPDCIDPALDLAAWDTGHLCHHRTDIAGNYDYFRRFARLKEINPTVKLLLGIGGYSVDGKLFSDLVADPFGAGLIFGYSLSNMMDMYNFDGVHFDWQYPNMDNLSPQDKENFPIFVSYMRDLDMIVGVGINVQEFRLQESYDVNALVGAANYVFLYTYDFKLYSAITPKIGHHSPLYYKESESLADQKLSVEWTVNNVISKLSDPGLRAKLFLGIPIYGRTYTISNGQSNFYDLALGAGPPFPWSDPAGGNIFYFEICSETINKGYEYFFDEEYSIPYMHNGETWIGYDDEYSAMEKVDFAVGLELGGVGVFSIDQDDYDNRCGGWYSNPIQSAIKNRMDQHAKGTVGKIKRRKNSGKRD